MLKNTLKISLICVLSLAFSAGIALFHPHNRNRVSAQAANDYRAMYMIDHDTGTVIKAENENDRYPIASMVKIMTLLLSLEEIDAGKMDKNEKIRISDYAAGMGGSQMFLDAGKEYPVNDLLKGVVVCSANDAAVALGERIAGDNDSFVHKMNDRARELHMDDTLFCNATGLPDSGEQYSTAKDVTAMMRELLSHPLYYEYTKITLEDYVHPDGRVTQMVNTNKLIRSYDGCDAGKTGFTDEAMFCLSSSAQRNGMRVVATLLGAPDSKTRFRRVSEAFSYAFANYEIRSFLKKNEAIPSEIEVLQAKNPLKSVVCDRDIAVFGKKGETENYVLSVDFFDDLRAPISRSTAVGSVTLLSQTGEVVSKGTLYPTEDVNKRNFFDNFREAAEKWPIAE